jgi:poly(3-hydroxybutyrate) depolymerase
MHVRESLALLAALAMLASVATPTRVVNAQSAGTTYDVVIPPGANFDKAAFRLWMPNGSGAVQGIVVLTPGSNGDGRDAVGDTVWQSFAVRHRLAIVASQLTDKPHEQGFIEDYVNVSRGSGQAFLDALNAFAANAKHAELATAPLLLWGMSAGGQFNYEFVAWKPERVIAFVVNKGGIYYSALVPSAARQVPGILFVGGKDLAFRTNTIVGLFAVNRRAGALWALAEEPSAGHIVGASRDVALVFFEDVLAMRRDPATPALRPVSERIGFIGDLSAHTFAPLGDAKVPGYPTAWLPSERVAKAWQAMVTEQPLPPAR